MAKILAERKRRLLALKRLRGGASAAEPMRCPSCDRALTTEELASNQRVCPYCGHHFPLGARERLELTLDPKSMRELDRSLVSSDPSRRSAVASVTFPSPNAMSCSSEVSALRMPPPA